MLWTTTPVIPDHWSCWLVLMGVRHSQHLESTILATPEPDSGNFCFFFLFYIVKKSVNKWQCNSWYKVCYRHTSWKLSYGGIKLSRGDGNWKHNTPTQKVSGQNLTAFHSIYVNKLYVIILHLPFTWSFYNLTAKSRKLMWSEPIYCRTLSMHPI